jgi:hypothetical protein
VTMSDGRIEGIEVGQAAALPLEVAS